MAAAHRFFATTAKGMEELLADELRALGAESVAVQRAGVAFAGSLEAAYRACLWSRVVNRVLLPLKSFDAHTPEELYRGVRTIRWGEHIGQRRTMAVDCSAARSEIDHSHFAALKTKDAIVDQMRERSGVRPDVRVDQPDVRVNVYLNENRAVISIDLSGESQHRRGYRQAGAPAPLKENLAAAVLLLADWPRRAREGASLLDPMCGTGTLPIEAALMAADVAPGLGRDYFGFMGWRGHDPALWNRLRQEAEERQIRDPSKLPRIRGYDADTRAVRAAQANVAQAGVSRMVHIEKRKLADCEPIAPRAGGSPEGVLVLNPPYGERIGDPAALGALYGEIGDVLRRRFPGWTGYVLTTPALAKRIGLRPSRRIALYNGALECRLLEFPISSTPVQDTTAPHWRNPTSA